MLSNSYFIQISDIITLNAADFFLYLIKYIYLNAHIIVYFYIINIILHSLEFGISLQFTVMLGN